MEDIYQWLYNNYALPELEDLQNEQSEILRTLAARLPLARRERICLRDMMEGIRLQWGTEAFALGVRFGMDLEAPRAPDLDCQSLAYFLP